MSVRIPGQDSRAATERAEGAARRPDFRRRRDAMVAHQVKSRGIRSELVLEAMRAVPREGFVPESLAEFAYEDAPLPIAEGETLRQPYIVALTTEALDLQGGERILEIGTGAGYGSAVLARIAKDVYTVERSAPRAEKAASALARLGYANVHVRHADGTLGWPEHAPYDAIVVNAGGPGVPEALKAQLAIGGRLVIAVGADRRAQELLRVRRHGRDAYAMEDIADVRLVPLIGAEGWDEAVPRRSRVETRTRPARLPLAQGIARTAEVFDDLEDADLAPLLSRIGDARVVLIG
jgi:protein-L-isoaspartate(D-aspartate) O-methyltransferase